MAVANNTSYTAQLQGPNLGELNELFGPIPFGRLKRHPNPGSATEEDLVVANERHDFLCELVDGILVEKAMGLRESLLTAWLIRCLGNFVEQRGLGIVLPPDGMMRLWAGRIRLPDISFISIARLPGGKVPESSVFDGAPDLAIEIISPGNTRQEMQQKLADYFKAGARLVWYIYPIAQEVHVYTAPEAREILTAADCLDGQDVLPGFSLALAKLFES